MKHKILHLGLILPVLVLSACSGFFAPSEKKAQKAFEEKLNLAKEDWMSAENKPVEIVQFKKINGQSGEQKGVKFYNFIFKAKLNYPEGYNTQCQDPKDGFEHKWNGYTCSTVLVRKPGEKDILEGELYFEQTEQGWQMKEIKITESPKQGSSNFYEKTLKRTLTN